MSKSARTQTEPFELPNLCDKSAVLFAVNEVIKALAQRRIRCSEAEVLIKGLKLASRLMTEIEKDIDQFSEPPTFFTTLPASQSQSTQNLPDLDHPATDDTQEPAADELEEVAETLRNAILHQLQSKQPTPVSRQKAHLLALAATAQTMEEAEAFRPLNAPPRIETASAAA